jgi:hypothetical protein
VVAVGSAIVRAAGRRPGARLGGLRLGFVERLSGDHSDHFPGCSVECPLLHTVWPRVMDELGPGLQAIRDHEREIGDDDFGPRVALRKDLARPVRPPQ